MNDNGIWKLIPGFSRRYEASSLGRIRCIQAGKGYSKYVRMINPFRTKVGYLYCAIWDGKKRQHKGVHQLVAAAFLGPCPEGCEVNHKNRDKTDNRPENLEYISHAENLRHARQNGNWSPPKGSQVAISKLTSADVLIIRQMLLQGMTERAIAQKYSVSSPTIHYIKAGKTWRHVQPEAQPVITDKRVVQLSLGITGGE